MNKSYDTIVVGELNVDLILNHIDGQPEIGKEKIAREMEMTLGSSSAIFANNIRSLGASVGFIGKIGDDSFGQFVTESLQSGGVDTGMIIKDPNLKTGITVAINYGDDRAMITYPGAMSSLSIEDIPEEFLKKARHLHVSSIFLQPGLKKEIGTLFKKAKEFGLTTSFDPQWDPEEKWDLNLTDILPYVDVFLPNEKELLNFTGENELRRGLQKLKSFSNVTVVKMGKKGSLSMSGEDFKHVEAFINEQVVDAIGAGDSFNAGFIFKYLAKESIEDCQRFGNLIGAISTTASGGTTAFRDGKKWKQTAIDTFHFKF